jgi:hypothetical protein
MGKHISPSYLKFLLEDISTCELQALLNFIVPLHVSICNAKKKVLKQFNVLVILTFVRID